MNLLIVNDVALTIDFLTQKIDWSQAGITYVEAASSSEAAKQILKSDHIDIVLCDIEMPGENGIELIKWVQMNHLHCDYIFLTCHANFEYLHEALHLECMDYILFPTTPANILQAVEKTIEKRLEHLRADKLKNYGEQWIDIHRENASSENMGIHSSDDIVANTIHYIMKNISSPELSVNEIAEKNYLSLGYLSRLFKKNQDVSISQFIIKTRMELAAHLLTEDKTTVSNIALEVGYNNYPYFTSTFKKFYGCTPSEYRSKKTNAE
ncbi:MAG: helix-turn-helix domain-containing protein [Lachnospiraceae bacterium]